MNTDEYGFWVGRVTPCAPSFLFGRPAGSGLPALPPQYTSTNTAASCADFTTSSNFRSAVTGALSLAETAGTDSRKKQRKDA